MRNVDQKTNNKSLSNILRNMLHSQVIFKSMKVADDILRGTLECEWVKLMLVPGEILYLAVPTFLRI